MILFIDDERRGIASYIEEIAFSGYQVELKNDIDSAFQFIKDNSNKIKLIILDIFMPPGKLLKSIDTDDGLKTGVFFYQEIRQISPDLPIIVFTNFSVEVIADQIQHDKQSKFLHKADYLPFQLIEEIENFLYNM